MPAATQYITELDSSQARQLDDRYHSEVSRRQSQHKANRKFYDGQHRKHLKTDNTGTEDNLIVNLIESVVDKSVSGLLGTDDRGLLKGVEFEVVDEPGEQGFMQRLGQQVQQVLGQPEEPAEEQQYLDAVMTANKKNLLLLNALMDGALTGHAFIKLMPEGRQHPETDSPLPRMVVLNPSNVTVFWSEDDVERVLWYRVEYEKTRQDIVRGVTEDGGDAGYWDIYDYRRQGIYGNQGRWELVGDPQRWAFPWAPIIDWQNLPNSEHGYYGKDDVGVAGALNDGLNFTLSNTQRILKYHAHPKTVGIGVGAEDIQATAVDGLYTVASENASIFNLEMQSDLSSSMSFANLLRRFLFDGSRELDPGSVQDKLGDITNFGLRVLYSDTLAKSAIKRLLAGDALRRLCKYILWLAGLNYRVKVNIQWPDPLPTDPMQTAQALQIMSNMGLSQETALERFGADPEQEAQRRETQRQERIEDQTVINQGQLTNTLEMLGRFGGGANGGGTPRPTPSASKV